MLYVFKNDRGVQIAWNSVAPRAFGEARSTDREKRSSMLGFVRTWSLG
jgi:hypothetical protein